MSESLCLLRLERLLLAMLELGFPTCMDRCGFIEDLHLVATFLHAEDYSSAYDMIAYLDVSYHRLLNQYSSTATKRRAA